MSKRPIQQKRLNRLRKAVNRRPLPAYTDLIWWLKFYRHARTTREAVELLLDGRLRSDSHVIGREKRVVFDPKSEKQIERWEFVRYVPARLRPTLTVVPR